MNTIAEYGHAHNPDVADLTAHEFIRADGSGAIDIEEDLKIIADMSILEEDDPTMPALTLRAVVIGLVRTHLFLIYHISFSVTDPSNFTISPGACCFQFLCQSALCFQTY